MMWMYLEHYWAVNSPCTWIFVCQCGPCCADPFIYLHELLPVTNPQSPIIDNKNINDHNPILNRDTFVCLGSFGTLKPRADQH